MSYYSNTIKYILNYAQIVPTWLDVFRSYVHAILLAAIIEIFIFSEQAKDDICKNREYVCWLLERNLGFMMIYFSLFGMYILLGRMRPQELSVETAASLMPIFGATILAINSIIATGFSISSNYDDLPFPSAFYLLFMLIGQVWGFILVATGLLILISNYWHNIFQPFSLDYLQFYFPPVEIVVLIIFWIVVGLKSTILAVVGAVLLALSVILLVLLVVYIHPIAILLSVIPFYILYLFIVKGTNSISI